MMKDNKSPHQTPLRKLLNGDYTTAILLIIFCLVLIIGCSAFKQTHHVEPHFATVIPFALLLILIATGPFIIPTFWLHHFHQISFALAIIVIAYYLFDIHSGPRMLETLGEYVSFIALIGSLFTIAGGIHIDIQYKPSIKIRVLMLFVGAVLANLIGTTGASMLLIRPWIALMQGDYRPHRIVLFIFIVSNAGGMLTPIGDPPLFLGYLKGVPFFFLLQNWQVDVAWIVHISYLLIVFVLFEIFSKPTKNAVPAVTHTPVTPVVLESQKGPEEIPMTPLSQTVFRDANDKDGPYIEIVGSPRADDDELDKRFMEMTESTIDQNPDDDLTIENKLAQPVSEPQEQTLPPPPTTTTTTTTTNDSSSQPNENGENDVIKPVSSTKPLPSEGERNTPEPPTNGTPSLPQEEQPGLNSLPINGDSPARNQDVPVPDSAPEITEIKIQVVSNPAQPPYDSRNGASSTLANRPRGSRKLTSFGIEPSSPAQTTEEEELDDDIFFPVKLQEQKREGEPEEEEHKKAAHHATHHGPPAWMRPKWLRSRLDAIINYTIRGSKIQLKGPLNFLWLIVIIMLVLMQKSSPTEKFKEKEWIITMGEGLHWTSEQAAAFFISWVFSIAMFFTALISFMLTNEEAERLNEMTFEPLEEVVFLFFGIFATMTPALDILTHEAKSLGLKDPIVYFWASGALSSVLDNAPTYINFLATAMGLEGKELTNAEDVKLYAEDPDLKQFVIAISIASVFFGACTYIGNGPNLMVKSICASRGAEPPSFFGYIVRYTLPILIPVFILIGFVFVGDSNYIAPIANSTTVAP